MRSPAGNPAKARGDDQAEQRARRDPGAETEADSEQQFPHITGA